jgi:hypothetical protein
MNYRTSTEGELLHTGDSPMLQIVAKIKHRSVIIPRDQLVEPTPINLLKRLPVAEGNSSFD